MLHKRKVSLGKNISNSSCISPPQNVCKISNISSWQLDALTYAKCWKANIRHSLKQLLNSSILCHLWKKLIYIVKPQPTWDSREAGAKLRFSGSLRQQKNEATVREKVLTVALIKWKIMILCGKKMFSAGLEVCCVSFISENDFIQTCLIQ